MAPRDVLVVDDTLDCRQILRGMLEGTGFHVRTAASGREALQAVAEKHPDVVLLDVMMPDMSGLDVIEYLRSAHDTACIPVILVTARVHDDDLMVGYQLGADYYITKPFTARQLVHGISLVLGEPVDRASGTA
jgi:DNA-binding response OmpR family regulator